MTEAIDTEARERVQRAWGRIKAVMDEENVAISVSHLGLLPDGRLNPVLKIEALPLKDETAPDSPTAHAS